jgi:hypothetical protein
MTAPSGLFSAAGLDDREPALSLLSLIRALHATDEPSREVGLLRQAVDRAWEGTLNGDTVDVPLPFPQKHFESLMRERSHTPDRFVAALLRERRASRVY